MQVAMLGPLEVRTDAGEVLEVGGARLRALPPDPAADLALREDDPERSATLLGAGYAIRGTTDRSVKDEERVAGQARSVLGHARYGQAYRRGQRVTVDTLAALVTVTPGA